MQPTPAIILFISGLSAIFFTFISFRRLVIPESNRPPFSHFLPFSSAAYPPSSLLLYLLTG
jgi:hypothetical protein